MHACHTCVSGNSIRDQLLPTDVMVTMDGSIPVSVEISHCEGRPIWFFFSVVVAGFLELEHGTAELRYPANMGMP